MIADLPTAVAPVPQLTVLLQMAAAAAAWDSLGAMNTRHKELTRVIIFPTTSFRFGTLPHVMVQLSHLQQWCQNLKIATRNNGTNVIRCQTVPPEVVSID